MAFKLGSLNLNAVAQGVGGLVFGNSSYGREEDDGGVEELLERISNGKLADDRRSAMAELEAAVAENRAAKLAFGAMGFPILMAVFREEREDPEMVRGALETLLHALTTEDPGQDAPGQVQAGMVNSELLAREPASVGLVLSLLDEPDFYVRYHTLQLLTALLSNCPTRLQDLILSIPQGITRLMDMLAEREVIRNEALIVLAYLTRSAEEIQKIVVFEGAFDRLFNIIREEGGSEGGIIVQDCLELLNNLLRNNPSNQIFLRETLGLQYVAQLLKLRKGSADGFTQQKSINLLCALETVALLLAGGPDAKPGKDANIVANQTLFAQNKLLDILLALSVEGRVSAVAIRCSALRCIGDLVVGHPANRDLLGSKIIGEEPNAEPALNCVLRASLNATNLSECIAAEYVFKCFCEGNRDGQTMLASTITPLPQTNAQHDQLDENEGGLSFGSMLVRALISCDGRNDLEASCRAASVLSHILKDNVQCKERVLQIPLEIPASSLSPQELLMPRCMKYLAAASPASSSNLNNPGSVWLQPVFLRLLVTWVVECPPAVTAILDPPANLPFLIELIGSCGSPASVHVAGLAAVLLGACIIYNSEENTKDSSVVVDLISQKIGLTSFFTKWEDMEKCSLFVSAMSSSRLPKALTRLTAAAAAAGDGMVSVPLDQQQQVQNFGGNQKEPLVTTFYDAEFVAFLKQLEPLIKERIVDLFSRPKTRMVVDFKGFDQKKGESETDYSQRLKSLLQTQAQELQELLEKNSALSNDLLLNPKVGGTQVGDERSLVSSVLERNGASANRAEVETLKRQLEVSQQWAEAVRDEKNELEREYLQFKQLAAEKENDFKGLSDAYNALEQENLRLEEELKTLRTAMQEGGVVPMRSSHDDLETAREEGHKESEGELNDLLVCLGQEETKVERLSGRLRELGEDVDKLLEGIGDPDGEAEDGFDDDNVDS